MNKFVILRYNSKSALKMKTRSTCSERSRTIISFDWAIKHLLRQKANFEILEGSIPKSV